MNIKQVKGFFEDKDQVDCPLTTELIRAGYQQTAGGYIQTAHEQQIEVNYTKAKPDQWWHLIKSYCANRDDDVEFTKCIQCGELIFWMAEVSGSVEKAELRKLLCDIIKDGKPVKSKNKNMPNVKYNRRKWNKEIQKLCFDKIVEVVEASENRE